MVACNVRFTMLNPVRLLQLMLTALLPVAGVTEVVGQEARTATDELRSLYEADQADRRLAAPPTPEQWEEISARDAERQARLPSLDDQSRRVRTMNRPPEGGAERR